MLRSLLLAAVLVSTLGVSACNSGNKEQQPTADEQKRIQEETPESYGATEATDIRLRELYEARRAQHRIHTGENERSSRPIIQSQPEATAAAE